MSLAFLAAFWHALALNHKREPLKFVASKNKFQYVDELVAKERFEFCNQLFMISQFNTLVSTWGEQMANQRMYTVDIKWSGKTEDPRTYDRSFFFSAPEKTPVAGSSEPASHGDPKKWNPEEMLLVSLASCQMLWYLYLCAKAKIVVTEYQDHPTGILNIDPAGKSAFIEATLNPKVVISNPGQIQEALALHKQAHELCYIANSVNFAVKINAQVQ